MPPLEEDSSAATVVGTPSSMRSPRPLREDERSGRGEKTAFAGQGDVALAVRAKRALSFPSSLLTTPVGAAVAMTSAESAWSRPKGYRRLEEEEEVLELEEVVVGVVGTPTPDGRVEEEEEEEEEEEMGAAAAEERTGMC